MSGGAKIPGLVVESPKGVVSKDFGKQREKEPTQNEAAFTLAKETMRRGGKRMRYLGDDTQGYDEREEDDREGDTQENEYQERRTTGKGRRTGSVTGTGKEGKLM